MKIWYESEDGVFFDDEDDCYVHEQKQKHNHLNTIIFFDENDKQYTIGENIFDEEIYQKAEKIIIHSLEELADLLWLSVENGWCEFEQIKKIGTWIRKENGFRDGIWKLEE